ncbi:MAG: TIR domain-containing protein [Anaerolineae bacterium]
MNQIFISYSSKNRDFALRLADKLERFYQVWIDRDGIEGGQAWEKAIEAALKDCVVFLVLVSPDSNDSDWVARETILAERLKKARIPVLLDGDLPFRLINLHYVDFRGDFEGGLRDLYEALGAFLNPQQKTLNDVDQLVGSGVRARLAGDFSKANDFIGQALALEPDIAASVTAFWERLTSSPTTNFAAQVAHKVGKDIKIVEKTISLDTGVYQDKPAYQWTVSVSADSQTLDQIDYVVYELHHTFVQPTRTIRDRASNFSLTMIGWGIFDIPVTIYFKDGSHVETSYSLTFELDNPYGAVG